MRRASPAAPTPPTRRNSMLSTRRTSVGPNTGYAVSLLNINWPLSVMRPRTT